MRGDIFGVASASRDLALYNVLTVINQCSKSLIIESKDRL